jgi:hypothetical protein
MGWTIGVRFHQKPGIFSSTSGTDRFQDSYYLLIKLSVREVDHSTEVSRLIKHGLMPPFVSVFTKCSLVKNTEKFANSVLV